MTEIALNYKRPGEPGAEELPDNGFDRPWTCRTTTVVAYILDTQLLLIMEIWNAKLRK